MNELEELKDTRANMQDRIRQISLRINVIEMDEVFKVHGVRVGSVVKTRHGKFLVKKIKNLSFNKPTLYGQKYKNNGSPGVRTVYIYSDDVQVLIP